MDDLKNVDLYDLLGVLQSATLQEIRSAYRKKALSCHPDKNPNNPKAGELFNQLAKALEILIDESARAAYDKVINAKKATALRNRELDSRRKRFKEELEARERQAQEDACRGTTKTAEEKLQTEIERLRKEGSKLLEEEIAYVQAQVAKECTERSYEQEIGDTTQNRLRVRWHSEKCDNANCGYSSEILNKIFSKYGEITALVVSNKKKGSALIEFKSYASAEKAQQLEQGVPPNLLTVEWLTPQSANRNKIESHHKPNNSETIIKEDDISAKQKNIFPLAQEEYRPSVTTDKMFPCFSSAPDMSNMYLQFMPATKLHTSFHQSLFSIRRNEYDRNVLSVNQVGLHTH